jgi:hypothetical protein
MTAATATIELLTTGLRLVTISDPTAPRRDLPPGDSAAAYADQPGETECWGLGSRTVIGRSATCRRWGVRGDLPAWP